MLINLILSLAKLMVFKEASPALSRAKGLGERSRESWLEEQRHRRAS